MKKMFTAVVGSLYPEPVFILVDEWTNTRRNLKREIIARTNLDKD